MSSDLLKSFIKSCDSAEFEDNSAEQLLNESVKAPIKDLETEESYAVIRMVNGRQDWAHKLSSTAMCGYLFESLDHWFQSPYFRVSVQDYLDNENIFEELMAMHDSEEIREQIVAQKQFMKYRLAIHAFLESRFVFNPKVHCDSVLGSIDENTTVSGREQRIALLHRMSKHKDLYPKEVLEAVAQDIVLQPGNTTELVKPGDLLTCSAIGSKLSAVEVAQINKNLAPLTGDKFRVPTKESVARVYRSMYLNKAVPPTSTMQSYQEYFTSNFDEIQQKTMQVYGLDPKRMFFPDTCINYVGSFRTEAEAEDACRKLSMSFASPFIIKNTDYCNITPYQELLEKVTLDPEGCKDLIKIRDTLLKNQEDFRAVAAQRGASLHVNNALTGKSIVQKNVDLGEDTPDNLNRHEFRTKYDDVNSGKLEDYPDCVPEAHPGTAKFTEFVKTDTESVAEEYSKEHPYEPKVNEPVAVPDDHSVVTVYDISKTKVDAIHKVIKNT